MSWRPASGPDVARQRAELLARIRRYFTERDMLEVDTPSLGRTSVTDPNVESLLVSSKTGQKRYLQTSPEYAMKRMLADGYPDIFSISRVFRDGESGSRHQPEFTMLEWYRRGYELQEIIDYTVDLITAILERPQYHEARIIDYKDAFSEYASVDVFTADIDELAAAADADVALRRSLGQDRQAWLDLLLSTRIAPGFADDSLTVLQHYPAQQAALARLSPEDNQVAERFEVFLGALELANGYVELTDASEQRQRFENDLSAREDAGQEAVPIDEELLEALESGLPACAGVAMGFERLHMVYAGVDDIGDVLSFRLDL